MLTPGFIEMHSITHVLNCAFDEAAPAWIKQKLGYGCLYMEDAPDVVVEDYLRLAEVVLDAWLRDPKCKTVFIHCQAGVNRSASIAAGYVARKMRIPIREVMEKMLRQRPCVFHNASFVQQLLKLQT